jgi:hypothetical protein
LAGSLVFVTVPVRPQGAKNGAIFAIMVQLNADYECRGTNFIGLVICHGRNSIEAALCSVAVQTWSDLRFCHGIKVFKRADAGIGVHEQVDLNSMQEQIAKIVTKKLPLPSVLCLGYLVIIQYIYVIGDCQP